MNSRASQPSSAKATMKSLTVYSILFAVSAVHMLNDSMQVVVSALFPIFQTSLNLSYAQIGWIAFTLNMTSSVMQPVVGLWSDRKPMPWLLIIGMLSSMAGIAGLAFAPNFWIVLCCVVGIGLGSAVFHPEGSRVVYLAAGNKRGLAQSIYQVGGNFGSSLAPLMTIFIFVPLGQRGAIWGTLLAATAIGILLYVVPWYSRQLAQHGTIPVKKKQASASIEAPSIPSKVVYIGIGILLIIVFARSWYSAAIGNYYQFFAREAYGLTIQQAQIPLYLFMVFGVVGTFFGGMLADRIGRRTMMIASLVGSIPLALLLPHVSLFWIYPVISLLGLILQSGFSVSVVYAQEIMPGKVGTASGLVTGFAFGMGAVGSVVLGSVADLKSMEFVMVAASLLPLIGLLSFVLPKDRAR
ncbi:MULTISPECIES: MFS transporter [Paenibacillus]|uniref:MFS transporter n=1 Tax=Paenibacillus TaxID=44249 RepID=UPI00203BD22B|nr:MFS transporter [Paenibacillus camelliae]MCM3635210.1 MFS transporter [Paenibacillus camelliae]